MGGDLNIVNLIKFVKITLGLPNKDIAKIFKISKQDLLELNYKHNPGIDHPVLKNFARITEIKSIFGELSKILQNSPGALCKTYHVKNQTLLDLLILDELNQEAILEVGRALSIKIKSKSIIHRKGDEISLLMLTTHVV